MDTAEKEHDLSSISASNKSHDENQKAQKKIQPKKGSIFLRIFSGSKPKPIVPNNEAYPFLTANFFSLLTFSWVSPIIKKGYLRRLEDEDLYKLKGDVSVKELTIKFEQSLEKRISKWRTKYPDEERYSKWVIILALNDVLKKQFWLGSGVSKMLSDLVQVLMPLLVRALIKYIQRYNDPTFTETKADAIGYAIGIAAMLLVNSILISRFFHCGMLTGAQVKGVLTNVIYKKAFLLSPKARFEFPNGKINSLVMADISRIDFCVGTLHFIWTFPITFSIGLIILCVYLGASALLGFAVILIVLISIFVINRKLKKLRIKSTVFIDKRVRAINEVINNLKMIKLYSWEKPYLNTIRTFRINEKVFIGRIQALRAHLNSAISSVTYIATMLTFIVLFYTSDNFQAYNIFSAISLFNMLRMPLNLLPFATALAIDASLAMERVSNFLQAEESEQKIERYGIEESPNSVEVSGAEFQWEVERKIDQPRR